MAIRKNTRSKSKERMAKKECAFCKEHKEPALDGVDGLKRFLTERGKILSRARSGVCARHQRALSTTVKQARFLALLAYTSKE